MFTCHGAIFRAEKKFAVASFDELADPNLRLDLIRIGDDVFGVRSRSPVSDRIERLDELARSLSRRFHGAFTVWYDSVWGAFRFAVFVHGEVYATLRTDGDDDDQWLDGNGKVYELGPPIILSEDGLFLTEPPAPTLPGRRDPARDCDLSTAAKILGIESLSGDDEDFFRRNSPFPAIKQNYE